MSLFGDARIKVSEIQMCGTDNLDIYFPKEGVSKIVAKEGREWICFFFAHALRLRAKSRSMRLNNAIFGSDNI